MLVPVVAFGTRSMLTAEPDAARACVAAAAGLIPAIGAICLLAVTWTASALAAARRG